MATQGGLETNIDDANEQRRVIITPIKPIWRHKRQII